MAFTIASIIAAFRNRGRGDPPSALSDIFVNPLLQVGNYLDAKTDFARTEATLSSVLVLLEDPTALTAAANALQDTVDNVTTQLKSVIEDIASNYGTTRRPATGSTGTVSLLRSSQVTTPITVPTGKQLSAPSLNQVYKITDTFNITSMTFDATLQKFVFSVPITSVNVGLATVAGQDQIVKLQDAIKGIEGVTNVNAVVGGRDEESDRDLVFRIQSLLSSNNIGTSSGYRRTVLSLSQVKDAVVIGAGNPQMLRDLGDGGSVDIIIANPIAVTVNELATSSNFDTGTNTFSPSRQPLINDVTTVQPTAISIGVDNGVFSGSLKGKDTIIFSSDQTGNTIVYQVNDLVRQVDDFMQDPERKLLGSDLLIRQAIEIPIDVIITISVLSEFINSKSTVRDNVTNAIAQLISQLNIGSSLDESDIVRVITNVPGVDRVNLPFTKFDVTSGASIKDPVTGVLNVLANQIITSGNVLVNM